MKTKSIDEVPQYPTPFTLPDPNKIPRRQWLYGRHLIRKNVSVTVAPGGVGKSSLSIVQALEMCSGRRLLGEWNAGPMNVWLFKLEDEREELNRRICAAAQCFNIEQSDLDGRLFVDSGRENDLILATQQRDSIYLNNPILDLLERRILENKIDVLIVDPFVSSHQVNEMDNGKMDIVAKAWVKLADRTNCAIELIHHTRKLNGAEATSDASRGASSLINAARSSRVLQRLCSDELEKAGVKDKTGTYFYVKRDKANLATTGERATFRTVSVDLGQGDTVGVVESFKMPTAFDGIGIRQLIEVQKAVDGQDYRFSEQAEDWIGYTIAEILGLDASGDRPRIKQLINTWLKSNALKKVQKKLASGKTAPVVEVGEWAHE